MADEICVSCHAPSLSAILYETVRSSSDQVGLLIGQICNDVTSKTTDANETLLEKKIVIYIEYCVPIRNNELFGNDGEVRDSVLKKYISSYPNNIVGWYSFRRNTKLGMCSLRELVIHKSLLRAIPGVNEELFTIALLSASVAVKGSTHSYTHIFMRYLPVLRCFEALRLKIYTLSDKAVDSNGYSTSNSLPTSDRFDKIIKGARDESSPVTYVSVVHNKVSNTLSQFHKHLLDLNAKRLLLEDEVAALRTTLGLDLKPVINVTLTEPPKNEELEVKCVRYDPSRMYNPDRTIHPFKLLNVEDLVQRKSVPQPKPTTPIMEVRRSYSTALAGCNTATNFNVKCPVLREGIGPPKNHELVPSKRSSSPDLFPDEPTSTVAVAQLVDIDSNSTEY